MKITNKEATTQVIEADVDFIKDGKEYSATVSYDNYRDVNGIWIWDTNGYVVYSKGDGNGWGDNPLTDDEMDLLFDEARDTY